MFFFGQIPDAPVSFTTTAALAKVSRFKGGLKQTAAVKGLIRDGRRKRPIIVKRQPGIFS